MTTQEEQDLLGSIDRARAVQKIHQGILSEHYAIMESGSDVLTREERLLAIERDLLELRRRYSQAEFVRLRVITPEMLDRTNGAHAIVLAIREDLLESANMAQGLRDQADLARRIEGLSVSSNLERQVLKLTNAGLVSAQSVGRGFEELLRRLTDWKLLAAVLVVLVLLYSLKR